MKSRNCTICGDMVAYSQPDGSTICAKPVCRQAAFRQQAASSHQLEHRELHNEHQRQLASVRDNLTASGQSRMESEDIAIGIVPFADSEIVPADGERQKEFLKNLHSCLEEFLNPEYEPKNARIGYGPTELEAVRITACTACRGLCCNQGETHAYLQPTNLEQLIDRNEKNALENAMALYASYLPAESVKDSCVFHTTSGCALPREIRSQTCNSFRCPDLRNIETFSASIKGETLLVAAVLNDELRNVQTVVVNAQD